MVSYFGTAFFNIAYTQLAIISVDRSVKLQLLILFKLPNLFTNLIEDADDIRRNLFILKLAVFLWLNKNYISYI